MQINQLIRQASYYAHLKAAEELSRLGMAEQAATIIEEANKISTSIQEITEEK